MKTRPDNRSVRTRGVGDLSPGGDRGISRRLDLGLPAWRALARDRFPALVASPRQARRSGRGIDGDLREYVVRPLTIRSPR